MGLFDQIKEGIAEKLLGGGDHNKLFESITGLINNPRTGGINGLMEIFKTKGLGDIFSSWISTGENKPITSEQVQHALGNEQIQKLAEQVGVSRDAVSQGLTSMLPEIIDKLTPNGTIPKGDMLAQGINAFREKFLKA